MKRGSDLSVIEAREVVGLAEFRQLSYEILKQVFYAEPKLEFVQALVASDILADFPFSGESRGIREGIQLVSSELEQNKERLETYFEELHWDYTKMFIGPNYLLAPPWESTYFNDSRLIFQEQTFEVREQYLKHQFIPRNFPAEPDDHMGCELDFMGKLNGLFQEAVKKGESGKGEELLKDQLQFISGHLNRWSGLFAENVEQYAQTDYYRGFARVLRNFIPLDEELLKDQLANLTTNVYRGEL